MCCAVRARWDPRPSARAFIAIMQGGGARRKAKPAG
jgi:hypothetical protein